MSLMPVPTSLGLAPLVAGLSTFALSLPPVPMLAGVEVTLQAAAIDTTTIAYELTNALAFTLEL